MFRSPATARRSPAAHEPAVLGRVGFLLALMQAVLPIAAAQAGDLHSGRRMVPAATTMAPPLPGQQADDLPPGSGTYGILAALVARSGCGERHGTVAPSEDGVSRRAPPHERSAVGMSAADAMQSLASIADTLRRGMEPIARREAAVVLHHCLWNGIETTDALRQLLEEFEPEMEELSQRILRLQHRQQALDARAFSTTTRLGMTTSFVSGAVRARGEKREADRYNSRYGAVTASYFTRLQLSTSFTGRDLLLVRLRAADFANAFNGNGVLLTGIDAAADTDDRLVIDRFHYSFPLGESVDLMLGPLLKTTDSVAIFPSVYGQGLTDWLLEFFAQAGISGVLNGDVGGGAALWWRLPTTAGRGRWNVSASYVDVNADQSNLTQGGAGSGVGGGSALVQVAYTAPRWGLATTYRYGQSNTDFSQGTEFVAAESWWLEAGHSHSVALSGYWQPPATGWVPSISAGWAINSLSNPNPPEEAAEFAVSTSQSWFVGLQWNDAVLRGNALGFAVGQPTFATRLRGGSTPTDGNYAFELWYKHQLTDAIHVVPAVYYLSRPLGQLPQLETGRNPAFRIFGALLQATLRF